MRTTQASQADLRPPQLPTVELAGESNDPRISVGRHIGRQKAIKELAKLDHEGILSLKRALAKTTSHTHTDVEICAH